MKKILVIDDDKHLQSDLATILQLEGYETYTADNGQEGLQAAQRHHPDLILCDVNMPVLNGFDMLTSLRRDPQIASIPVIFLTAFNDSAFVRWGMELGAASYISKPYNLDELLAAIKAQLGE